MLAKVLQFLETTLYSRAELRAEGSSSIMTKVEMEKDIQLQMDFFLPLEGSNSIGTNLQTCNLNYGPVSS